MDAFASLDASMFLPILPEILLLLLGAVVLTVGLILPDEKRRALGWVTAVGAVLVILFSLPAVPGAQPEQVWGGAVRYDWMSFVFKMLFVFGAGITALLAMDYKELGSRLEFYVLMIASTSGISSRPGLLIQSISTGYRERRTKPKLPSTGSSIAVG